MPTESRPASPGRGRAASLAIILGMVGCHAAPPPTPGLVRPAIPLGLDLYLPVPVSNPLTAARVALGRALFFDPMLSVDSTLACATCHDLARTFTDARPRSIGVGGRVGIRNVPTLINRAYGSSFFWDGRSATLEQQVLGPIQDPTEMGLPLTDAVGRVRARPDYRRRFAEAFGGDVTGDDLARALAAYVRTILAGNAPVDRYHNGDPTALSEIELAGLRLFRGKANCTSCHMGPTFTDERFHNTGVAWRDGVPTDSGRFRVTARLADVGAFKTPTLREVARTAPYMHDGSLATLEEVVAFYDRGGEPNPHLDREMRPLKLTGAERQALIAFLRALSGEVREGVPTIW